MHTFVERLPFWVRILIVAVKITLVLLLGSVGTTFFYQGF